MRLLKASAKADTKKHGKPEPIIQDASEFVALGGGGLTTPELAERYGLAVAKPPVESSRD
jgi:hypothetical protein